MAMQQQFLLPTSSHQSNRAFYHLHWDGARDTYTRAARQAALAWLGDEALTVLVEGGQQLQPIELQLPLHSSGVPKGSPCLTPDRLFSFTCPADCLHHAGVGLQFVLHGWTLFEPCRSEPEVLQHFAEHDKHHRRYPRHHRCHVHGSCASTHRQLEPCSFCSLHLLLPHGLCQLHDLWELRAQGL